MELVQLVNHPTDAVDLTTTPIHLGRGSRARPVAGFAWDPAVLGAYGAAVADDGVEGRLVAFFEARGAGDSWERHPAGDEVVLCVSGRVTMHRDDGISVELGPGEAMVNPPGVWHTADIDEPSRILTITPGVGTEHKPR